MSEIKKEDEKYECECGAFIKNKSRNMHIHTHKHRDYCIRNNLDLPVKKSDAKGRPRIFTDEEIKKKKSERSLRYYRKNKDKINDKRFKKHICKECNHYYTLDKKAHHMRTERHIRGVEMKKYLENKMT